MGAVVDTTLPAGVVVRPLESHVDDRGTFTELYRQEWATGVSPIQWNAVRSDPGVLRGVHVHLRHDDYLTRPIRPCRDWPARPAPRIAHRGRERPRRARGEDRAALVIPHGVAHGFYFSEPSLHVYAVTEYWDPSDELGCHWADPELEIPWPVTSARVSERDAASQSLRDLLRELAPSQPI